MIKANELRIGNLILLDGKNVAKVSSIFSQSNSIITENDHNVAIDGTKGDYWKLESDFIQPIPLTPEWLERMGFLKVSEYHPEGSIYRGGGSIQFDACPLYKFIDIHTSGQFNSVREQISYVHQLQNIYFALTGEELTIKEQV